MIRQFLSALLVVAFIPVWIGCQSDSPEGTAQEFLNSFYQMDFDKAIALSTPQQAELVKQVEQFASLTSDSARAVRKNVKVEIVNVAVDGDNAIITYTNSLEPSESTLKMTKESGKWLANNSKEDITTDVSAEPENDEKAEEPAKEQ